MVPASGPDPLDVTVVESLRELGDESLLEEVVHLYLDDSPLRIAAIREALASGDGEALARAAHGLKSSSGNVGAVVVCQACSDLETYGNGGAPLDAQAKLHELEHAWDAAARALRDLIHEV